MMSSLARTLVVRPASLFRLDTGDDRRGALQPPAQRVSAIQDSMTSKSKQNGTLDRAQMLKDIEKHAENIFYSSRYQDEEYEYRHVILPKALVKYLPKDRLATEDEWRGLGIRQSPGWEHYMVHQPEPHILLFKREKDYQLKYPA